MKEMFSKYKWFIITILGLLLINWININQKRYWKERFNNQKQEKEIVYNTDTITVSKTDTIVEYKTRIFTEFDTLLISKNLTKEDSTKIFEELYKVYEDYNTKKTYSDIIVEDSTMFVSYKLNVFNNKLDSIGFKIKNNLPYYINNDIHHYYSRVMLGASVLKSDVFIEGGYLKSNGVQFKGYYSPITKSYGAGVSFTLFKFKQ